MPQYRVLVINPGSTSTKIAVFDDSQLVFQKNLQHNPEELAKFGELINQFEFRKKIVEQALEENSIHVSSIQAVVGRGGLVRPVESGVYKINKKMLADLKDKSIWGRVHASNLGAFITKSIGDEIDVPSFIVDPVTVDEMEDIAKVSGVPEYKRTSIFHALNIKSVTRKCASDLGKTPEECNFVGVHMGGGISIATIKKGKVVDINNALLGMGAFSPQRAGSLPLNIVIDMCYSGKYTRDELEKKLLKKSGLIGYLGTDNGAEIEKKILKEHNNKYRLIYEAMAYQIAKEVGAGATVLKGKVDAIFYTGGLAYSKILIEWLKERTSFLAPIYIYPGEKEMIALAESAIRVLQGEVKAKEYN
jgi:butyrate kinase